MTSSTGTHPALHIWTPPAARAAVRAVALVLHGGRSQSSEPTSARHLAVARMLPFDRALRQVGSRTDGGLAVARLRYRVRGWNGAAQNPVRDTRWALERLHERFPDVPFALVGHSMGGRTAVHVADDPAVAVVVGLAPWIQDGDPLARLAGRRVLLVHGDRDTWTDPHATAQVAERLRGTAAQVAFVCVRGEGHAMLRRPGVWHRLTAGYVAATLLGTPPADPLVAELLAGAPILDV